MVKSLVSKGNGYVFELSSLVFFECMYDDSGWARMFIRKHRQTISRRKKKKSVTREPERNKRANIKIMTKTAESVRLYQQRVLWAAFDAYGGACICCGQARKTFLELDHTNNDGKDFREKYKCRGGFPTAVYLRKEGYPPGIQVLCANCHKEKTVQGRCACSDTLSLAS